MAYATLYHQLWRGEYITDAVAAMRVASGNQQFFLEHAEESRQAYLNYINTVDPARAQENLESIVANETSENQQSLKGLSNAL